ncbi:MAG: cupin domain-containing protein [Anaerolineae bacterium]|nr:cupin domain-containing protein [Anaerolineae bacterium]
MTTPYTLISAMTEMVDIQAESIVSRTVFEDETVKIVLFGFAAGQSLSEHTSTYPAMLHFIQGEARVTLGEDSHDVKTGAWSHMPPRLPHSIEAQTDVLMLLYMMKG